MAQELTPNFISEDIFRFIPSQLNIIGWGVRSKAVMTRSMVKNYPTLVSCRTWQLVYFVLFYYNKYTHYSFIERLKSYIESYRDISLLKSGSEIGADFQNISNILNFILDKRYANPLYTIVIDAKINKRTDVLQKITTLEEIYPFIDNSLALNNICCCLYSESPDDMYRDVYILNHFFTIIYLDNVFYINSAYGSSFVRVPQYSTIITAEEFNYFCSALPHVKDGDALAQKAVNDFFIKFFLTGNLSLPRPRADDDDDDDDGDGDSHRRRDMMSPEEGIHLEITQYINSGKRNTLGVGFIPSYNSLVTSSIESFLAQQQHMGGRHKKTRKSKKTRKTKKSKRKSRKSRKSRKT